MRLMESPCQDLHKRGSRKIAEAGKRLAAEAIDRAASAVAWINSEPITIEELMPRMLELRSAVAAEWVTPSGDVSSDSFWYEAQNGHTTMEALR